MHVAYIVTADVVRGEYTYIGHNDIGHNYMGNDDYIGHNYIGHNYIGYIYIGHNYMHPASTRARACVRACVRAWRTCTGAPQAALCG